MAETGQVKTDELDAQAEARRRLGIDDDRFIVLVADRNQGRKRLDLAFDAFARFAAGRDGVCLAYHGAPDEDVGWNVEHMATDFGIADKFALTVRDMQPLAGVGPRVLSLIYSAADIKLSTTSGEGWGLTTMEAMSCGLPCIVPDAAALGEWTQGAAWCVPAPIRTRHVKINTVGRVPEVGAVEAALIDLYDHPETRADLSRRGLELVSRPEYDWANIADDFDTLLRRAMYPPSPLKGGEAGPIAVEQMAEALC
jgi:glycosyltransferase involved in cell wall biosynthesis